MITGRRTPCLVRFETYTTVDGQYGETKTWTEFKLAWVNIEPIRGRERYSANELESEITHTVRMAYYEGIDITPHMRMVFAPTMDYGVSPSSVPDDALVYEILAVMPDHNHLTDVVLHVEQEGRTYGEITS